MKFPGPDLEIDENGQINFTEKQWKILLKAIGSKAKTLNGQRKAIKKLIEKAIKERLSQGPAIAGVGECDTCLPT
jgi:hypothetical protein